jgi:cytosine/uracil/thiamine/allantoin permease
LTVTGCGLTSASGSVCCSLQVSDWSEVAAGQPSLFDTGGLVPDLTGCFVLAWLLIWLCVSKGVDSIGKVCSAPRYMLSVLLLLLLLGLVGAAHCPKHPRTHRTTHAPTKA